jgi:GNAT superfamily N-acetyltransferase
MYLTRSLDSTHNRSQFSCGKESLDHYFKNQVSQDIKRKLSACFVLPDMERNLIKGYYTLSNASIPLELVPGALREKLPKSYKSIPATLLGRLTISVLYQNQGIGKLLLLDAFKRSYDTSKSIGSFAVVVDPLDEQAQSFYTKYGFISLPDSGKMLLSMKKIELLFI